jgi:hypothetical protein
MSEAVAPFVVCARCKHPRAYHEDPARPCYAWDPDRPDHKCACEGWVEPKPEAPPATSRVTVYVDEAPPEEES